MKIFSRAYLKKFSSDHILWIWAIGMALFLFLFGILSRNLPGLSTRLVFAQWWTQQLPGGTLEDIIADFEKENPKIKVRLEIRAPSEILAQVEMGDKKTPDIFSADPSWELKNDDKGRRLLSFIEPMFYNIDLLKASGFDRPPRNQTEFLSYAEAITDRKNGVYGAAAVYSQSDPQSLSRHILSWFRASGAGRTPDGYFDAASFSFNTKPVIETLGFLKSLQPYMHPDPYTMTEGERLDLFARGKIGMMIGPVSEIADLRGERRHGENPKTMSGGFGITVIPSPAGFAGDPVFSMTNWLIAVNGKGRHREEAELFTDFLLKKASLLSRAAYAIPGGGERDMELIRSDPYYSKAFDMYDAMRAALQPADRGDTGFERPGKNPGLLDKIILEELQSMFKNEISPEQCAEALQQRWEEMK